MKKTVKKYIRQKLADMNKEVRIMMEKEKVMSFIKKLRPYDYKKGLIRLGPVGDGGYLVPDDIDGIQACFSPGVSNISEFELSCYEKGMSIYMADKSVDSVNLKIPEDQYGFIKKFVGCTNNDDFITLDEWVNSSINETNTDLILQMDIEGGEYETLMATSDSLINRFRIIVIEFHELEKLWDPEFFKFAEITFNKLLQTHKIVHIHPNNCCGSDFRNEIEIPRIAEFTFIRKDRINSETYANKFPHELDSDNTAKEHMVLPKIWYN